MRSNERTNERLVQLCIARSSLRMVRFLLDSSSLSRRAPDESPIEPGPGATAGAETRSGRNLEADGRDWLARQRQSATCWCAHCRDDMVAYPRTGEAPAESRSRNMRSRCRCSVCPAIHISSRSWLRSSSTHEPSDPPHRAVLTHHERAPFGEHTRMRFERADGRRRNTGDPPAPRSGRFHGP